MQNIFETMNFEFLGTGKHKISAEKFIEMENVLLLDVRTKEEASVISINETEYFSFKYLNIPLEEISKKIKLLSKDLLIVAFCPGKVRASMVYAFLLSEGYNVKIFDGGYSELTSLFKTGKVFKASKK